LTWSLHTAAILPLSRRYSPLRLSAVLTTVGSIPLLATAAVPLGREGWTRITPLAWGAFAYSLLLAFVLTNVIWFGAIRRVGAARASLYTNLQPFLAAVFALALLSEHPDPLQLAGGAAIAAGIAFSQFHSTSAPDSIPRMKWRWRKT